MADYNKIEEVLCDADIPELTRRSCARTYHSTKRGYMKNLGSGSEDISQRMAMDAVNCIVDKYKKNQLGLK